MQFEFDKKKSESNKRKHGLDFVEAQTLWEDPDRIEVPAKTEGENRFVLTGLIGDSYWSAVFTIRADSIRIISVRPARKQEVKEYEN